MIQGFKFGNFLYQILIVCICFEEMFAKTTLPLTSIKYIISFTLLLPLFIDKRRSLKVTIPKYIYLFYLFVLLYFFISIRDFIYIGWDGFKILKQYIWLPLFVYIILNSRKLATLHSSDLMKIYIRGMVVYAILNVCFYFFKFPIWKVWHPYWGRITVGYPTVDVVMMSLALLILQLHPNVRFKIMENILYSLILIFSVVSQSSGTGILLLLLYVIVTTISFLYDKDYSQRILISKKWSYSVVFFILILSLSSVYSFFLKAHPELTESLYIQLENRINIMTNNDDKSTMQLNTLLTREMEFEMAEREMLSGDLNKELFGDGFGKLTPDHLSRGVNRFYIEDMYHLLRLSMGWIFTIYFYIILFLLIIKVMAYNISVSYKLLMMSAIISLAASSFTSFSLGSIGIAGALAIIIVDFYKNQRFVTVKRIK